MAQYLSAEWFDDFAGTVRDIAVDGRVVVQQRVSDGPDGPVRFYVALDDEGGRVEVGEASEPTVTFEQSYGGIDGDSASSAELYALLSSLARVPLRQGIAVSGSVNQKGEIQPIGGVNEKIHGFYDICKMINLTGEQGVVIPKLNKKDLMLRQDVVKDIEAGKFHIYAIETIDEGIEILTGKKAGKQLADGEPRIMGVMIESNLVEGNQKLSDDLTYGQSITDACISWDDSVRCLEQLAEATVQRRQGRIKSVPANRA